VGVILVIEDREMGQAEGQKREACSRMSGGQSKADMECSISGARDALRRTREA